jgi:adenosylmethionine-8-amino-7-oxononanoate aminotransferase
MSSPLRIWHPFTNSVMDPAPIEIERAEGVWLYAKNGRQIIDAVSSWWVNIHGHAIRVSRGHRGAGWKMEHVILAGLLMKRPGAGSAIAQVGCAGVDAPFFSMMARPRWKFHWLAVQHFGNNGRPEK